MILFRKHNQNYFGDFLMQMFDTISDYVTQNLIDWSIMSNRAKTNKDLISTF